MVELLSTKSGEMDTVGVQSVWFERGLHPGGCPLWAGPEDPVLRLAVCWALRLD